VRLHVLLVFILIYLCGCGKREKVIEQEVTPPSLPVGKFSTIHTVDNSTNEHPFASAEGGFRVQFPVPPTEKKVLVPLGETTMYTAEKDGELYAVSRINVRIGSREETEAYLEDVTEAFSSQPFIRQVKRRSKIVLQDYPGREIVVQTPVSDMRIRWYVARGRLYQLGVTGTAEAVDSERWERFFKSFAFLD
jgi:hypothetical protein